MLFVIWLVSSFVLVVWGFYIFEFILLMMNDWIFLMVGNVFIDVMVLMFFWFLDNERGGL